MRYWLTACLAGNLKSLPPVNDMQGMAFVATVLDHAELHLRSIAAHAAADRVSILRGMIDAVFQARRRTWVLESRFTSRVGHFVFPVTRLALLCRGLMAHQENGCPPGT